MKNLLSTKDVARLLGINEKMVYTLVSEKGLPATKVTGKWIFPGHLVEQWIETNTINYPSQASNLPPYHGLLIIAGSNDPLLEKTISLFNRTHTDHIAVFGNIGSMGGLAALKKNRCHIATSHLLQDDDSEYNFDFATRELDKTPAVVNFCRREQGLLLQKGNPKKIKSIADLAKPDTIIVNRPMSTGTRLLLDTELKKTGTQGDKIKGYTHEVNRHIDVGLEILSGKADAGLAIRPVASLLGLNFLPLRWERYDLLISKEKFFDKGVQLLIGLLHEKIFSDLANSFNGYDINSSGKVIFPYEDKQE
ncbi:MAG: helix-turn-helix transcriptional regulator [Deltaproteobacteria bacterium]|nr:helix-turn-helix transcriptional regulator [Deltaproteobacteria bacterium]